MYIQLFNDVIMDFFHIITYHHGYTKKNNGMYHAIKTTNALGHSISTNALHSNIFLVKDMS